MSYIENLKSKGSGVVCCTLQTNRCPDNCEDCYFQSDRSHLEPLEGYHLSASPQVPTNVRVVRVNVGNDDGIQQDKVISQQDEVIRLTNQHSMRFFDTSIPYNLERFPAPVVLTINPGKMTDEKFYEV